MGKGRFWALWTAAYLLGGNHDADLLDGLGELVGLDGAVVVEIEVLEGLHQDGLQDSKVDCGVWWGWWGPHGSSFQLPPGGVTKVEEAPLHDEPEGFDDCFDWAVRELVLVVLQVLGDLVDCYPGWDVGVH